MKQTGPRLKRCPACDHFVAASSLVQGECTDCAGLIALPLRIANGRFMAVPQVGTKTRR